MSLTVSEKQPQSVTARPAYGHAAHGQLPQTHTHTPAHTHAHARTHTRARACMRTCTHHGLGSVTHFRVLYTPHGHKDAGPRPTDKRTTETLAENGPKHTGSSDAPDSPHVTPVRRPHHPWAGSPSAITYPGGDVVASQLQVSVEEARHLSAYRVQPETQICLGIFQ